MKKSTLILITVLTIGAIGSIILQVFILPNQNKNASQTDESSTTTLTVSPTATSVKEYASSKEKLIDLLPVKTDTFTMEYLSSEDSFIVLIKTVDLNEGQDNAVGWLEEEGISDWEDLDIIWGGGKRL